MQVFQHLRVMFAGLIVLAGMASAQPEALGNPGDTVDALVGEPTGITSDCDGAGGLSYDDGAFEAGIRPTTPDGFGNMVTRFDLPAGTHRLGKVCVCWIRFDTGTDDLDYSVRVWAANGPGGVPGSLLAESVALTATGIPGAGGRFYTADLTSLNIQRSGSIYIGPRWAPGTANVFLCSDRSATTPARPNYFNVENFAEQPPTSEVPADNRALGIRATIAQTQAPTCTPGATTLCLNDGRFRVTVTWRDFQGQTGSGQAIALPAYDDSGLFYFFSSNNLEMLIKVLDGCSINDNYWVFFAGTTNVEFEVTVTDTDHNLTKTYDNALGHPANAVTDTAAFATCP